MENLSVIAVISSTPLKQKNAGEFKHSANATAKPTKEKVDHLNKIGHEYPFCVFHKHKKNDPL